MPNPVISVPAGEPIHITDAEFRALVTIPACPQADPTHEVLPVQVQTTAAWDAAVSAAPGDHGMLDGMVWSRNPDFLLEGVPLHSGRTYTLRYGFYCQVRTTEAHGGHVMWEEVDVVTTGEYQPQASDASLHHNHYHLQELVDAILRLHNDHDHFDANTPIALAFANHLAMITRLQARVAALENAQGQVVGNGEDE